MTELELYNSTLREGSQHTNVHFGLSEMEEIAEALLDSGNAHLVEIHCYPGERNSEIVRRMLDRFGDRIVTHHRAYDPDIENRIRVADFGNTSMFQTVSDAGLFSLRMGYPDLKDKIRRDVSKARAGGLTVAKYTLEHATDARPELLKELALIAQDAGAQRIGIPDTKGRATPDEYGALMEYLMSYVEVPLTVHCHDDLGLAVANSLAAYDAAHRSKAGKTVLDSSILGIGERAGETKTEVLNTLLRVKREENIPTEHLYMLTELVSGLTGVYPGPHDPIAGDYAFTQRAGTHHHKINKINRTNGLEHPYLPFDPSIVGRTEEFNISPYSGVSTIETALAQRYGITDVSKDQLEGIAARVRGFDNDVMPRDFDYLVSEELVMPLDNLVKRRKKPETSTYRIFIQTNGSNQKVAQEIRRAVRPARYIDEIFGEYDIVVVIPRISAELGNAYVDMIKRIPDVTRTTTYISARSWK